MTLLTSSAAAMQHCTSKRGTTQAICLRSHSQRQSRSVSTADFKLKCRPPKYPHTQDMTSELQ